MSIPEDLAGIWTRDITRNNSIGVFFLEISENCELDSYEIGDSRIMDQWYSGLPSNITYKFTTLSARPILAISGDSITTGTISSTAKTHTVIGGELVQSWVMGGTGGTYSYDMPDKDTLIIYNPPYTTNTYSRSAE